MRCLLKLFIPLSLLLLPVLMVAQGNNDRHPSEVVTGDSALHQHSYHAFTRPIRPATFDKVSNQPRPSAPAIQLHSTLSSRFNTFDAPQCRDTSLRLLYGRDLYSISNDPITRTRDGNVLIPGYEAMLTPPYLTTAHVLKITPQGDTIWTRKLDIGYHGSSADVYHAFEMKDGSILLVGNVWVPMPVNGRQDFLMVKLTSAGDLVWQKTFSNTYWNKDTTGGSLDIYDYTEDEVGNAYLCGVVEWFGYGRASIIYKMSPDGTIIWSKNYFVGSSGLSQFTGIDFKEGKLKVFGSFSTSYSSGFCGLGINSATGDTLWMKAWQYNGDLPYWHRFNARNFTKLNNGNYALSGECNAYYDNLGTSELATFNGIAEFTPSFDFVHGTLFRSPTYGSYGHFITVFADGSACYERRYDLSLQSSNLIIGNYQNGQIVKERSIPYRDAVAGWTSNFLQTEDGGQLVSHYYIDYIRNTSSIEWMRLHNSDTSGSCIGNDTMATIAEPVQFSQVDMYIDSINSNVLYERNHPYNGIYGTELNINSNCKQVNYCDSFKLIPSLTTLCLGTPVTLTIRKNKACGAFPAFSYDTSAIQSFVRLTDSTTGITFRKEYQGYVSAFINGCKPLSDSVQFTVLQAPAQLNIGPDTAICPGNTVILNAHKGYASYRWQDGSADSAYTITAPGKYFVSTTDACGGSFSDTVVAVSHPPISFDAGPDLTVCTGSSVTITAPAGFISYRWSPAVGLNSTSGQTVIAAPRQTIWYKVTAEQRPGCFASDSLVITVKGAPPIHLGNDTTLCQDESLYLSAGTGFNSYMWSTGESSPSIKVNTQGAVWIKGEKDGCTTTDTLIVKAVYPLPSFTLGGDTLLCEGNQIAYDFNLSNALYLWNDGSTSSNQIISKPGIYWLAATQQGCTSSDTIEVKFQPSPIINLGKDTTLCEGITKLLDVTNLNAVCQWQDNSTLPQYEIDKPGLYYVKVSINGCSASDSINIGYTPKPVFDLGKDLFLCKGSSILLAPSINTAVSYLWQDGSTQSSNKVKSGGVYTLTATNVCGSRKDSLSVTDQICQLSMPSAFTPNKDGINDVFKLRYPFPVKQFQMVVYNRWGQKVFESHDTARGWNGTINNVDQDMGTYIWMISLVDTDNIKQTAQGTVTLIR